MKFTLKGCMVGTNGDFLYVIVLHIPSMELAEKTSHRSGTIWSVAETQERGEILRGVIGRITSLAGIGGLCLFLALKYAYHSEKRRWLLCLRTVRKKNSEAAVPSAQTNQSGVRVDSTSQEEVQDIDHGTINAETKTEIKDASTK